MSINALLFFVVKRMQKELSQKRTQFNFNINISYGFRFMVFNAIFNNISVMSRQSVLLVEETRVPGENHQPVANHWQTYHIVLCPVQLAKWDSNSQHD